MATVGSSLRGMPLASGGVPTVVNNRPGCPIWNADPETYPGKSNATKSFAAVGGAQLHGLKVSFEESVNVYVYLKFPPTGVTLVRTGITVPNAPLIMSRPTTIILLMNMDILLRIALYYIALASRLSSVMNVHERALILSAPAEQGQSIMYLLQIFHPE